MAFLLHQILSFTHFVTSHLHSLYVAAIHPNDGIPTYGHLIARITKQRVTSNKGVNILYCICDHVVQAVSQS